MITAFAWLIAAPVAVLLCWFTLEVVLGLRPLPPEGQGSEARGPEGGKEAATVHGSSYHRILRSWSARAISGVKA